MSVTLDITPELEASLQAQARAQGLPLEQFLQRQLELLAQGPVRTAPKRETWAAALDEWLDSFPQGPALPDEAYRRETQYQDRW